MLVGVLFAAGTGIFVYRQIYGGRTGVLGERTVHRREITAYVPDNKASMGKIIRLIGQLSSPPPRRVYLAKLHGKAGFWAEYFADIGDFFYASGDQSELYATLSASPFDQVRLRDGIWTFCGKGAMLLAGHEYTVVYPGDDLMDRVADKRGGAWQQEGDGWLLTGGSATTYIQNLGGGYWYCYPGL